MDYLLRIGIELCIYVMLILSANLTVGLANLLTLCQAAFYGIGAYLGAFFLMQFNLPFVVIALIVMVATGVLSLIISYASLKLKGDYFILATLAFQFIVVSVLYNWYGVTGGPFSLSGIPPIKFLGMWPLNRLTLFLFTVVCTAVVLWIFGRLQHSPFGRMLRAIRSDESSSQALGRNTTMLKVWAFFLSAAFASVAGVIYASLEGSISPAEFSLDRSILIITALFIGGTGTKVWGPVAGAVVLVILPELLMMVGISQQSASELRQVVFGLVLIALMFYRPRGLFGDMELK